MFLMFTALNLLMLSIVQYNTECKWYQIKKKRQIKEQINACLYAINTEDIFILAEAMINFAGAMNSKGYKCNIVDIRSRSLDIKHNDEIRIMYSTRISAFDVTDSNAGIAYSIYQSTHIPASVRNRWEQTCDIIRKYIIDAIRGYALQEYAKEVNKWTREVKND